MDRQKGFIGAFLQRAELWDISKKLPLTELAGNRRVLIENHQCIMQFTPHCICVKVSFGCIRVTGQNLALSQMSCTKLVIDGDVESVVFQKKDTCRRK